MFYPIVSRFESNCTIKKVGFQEKVNRGVELNMFRYGSNSRGLILVWIFGIIREILILQ